MSSRAELGRTATVTEYLPTIVERAKEHAFAAAQAGGRAGAHAKLQTDDVVVAADVILTMGCGDACPIYPGGSGRATFSWTSASDLMGAT